MVFTLYNYVVRFESPYQFTDQVETKFQPSCNETLEISTIFQPS